ncbi:hypothetical protein [Kamptonema formosum]|nr:hypothetical protein [Oscillatoria sp. PCC 10802]
MRIFRVLKARCRRQTNSAGAAGTSSLLAIASGGWDSCRSSQID